MARHRPDEGDGYTTGPSPPASPPPSTPRAAPAPSLPDPGSSPLPLPADAVFTPRGRRVRSEGFGLLQRGAGRIRRSITDMLGGPARARVIVLLAAVLALSSADASTVGASAVELREALHIGNADIGLLVAVTAAVGAVASVPFGILVDRVRRVGLLVVTILLWGVTMLLSASVSTFGALLLVRMFLGVVTAVAGPAVASLVGDYFPGAERGKIYGYILSGELIGAGVGFFVTGDVAALSWRAAFVVLGLLAFTLAWYLRTLKEPARGGASRLLPGATEIVDRRTAGGTTTATDAESGAAVAGERSGADGEAEPSDAQRLARELGIEPDFDLVLHSDPRRMNIVHATRYVLAIRTNIALIVSSAFAYFFLTGVQTFGLEFAGDQYGVHTILANLLMLVVGAGAVIGVLSGGRLGDLWVQRGRINGRVVLAGIAALATVALFIPALTTSSPLTALPYITAGAFCLTAQNPPLDAARLDIMPPLLWGRAEGIRTFLRAAAQAIAPVTFGGLSELLAGTHHGLQITFGVMLVPLAASGVILLRGARHYPRDVATAAASAERSPP